MGTLVEVSGEAVVVIWHPTKAVLEVDAEAFMVTIESRSAVEGVAVLAVIKVAVKLAVASA